MAAKWAVVALAAAACWAACGGAAAAAPGARAALGGDLSQVRGSQVIGDRAGGWTS